MTRRLAGVLSRGLVLGAVLALSVGCVPGGPDTAGFGKAAGVAGSVSPANLESWVSQICAAHTGDTPVSNDGFPAKDEFPSGSLTRDAAVTLLSSELTAMGYAPQTIVLGSGPPAAYNVVAEWPGTDRANEVVLVGAHLDAFYAGADDNTSAVAAVLEAARVARAHAFSRTVRFVFFDLEEFGAIGSTRYIQAGMARDVVSAVVVETVGYASSAPGSQQDLLALRLPDRGDFLLVAANEDSVDMAQRLVALGNSHGLAKLVGIAAPGDGAYFLSTAFLRSDNGLLWYQGVPTLLLTDTANFRNPHYHTASDTPDTLDYGFLAGSARTVLGAISLFAEVQL